MKRRSISVGGSQPGNDRGRRGKDGVHLCYLRGAFFSVLLVNADSINPNLPQLGRNATAESAESIE